MSPRRRRPLSVLVPIALATPLGALLVAGLALALTGRFGAPLGPPVAAARDDAARTGRLQIVALGDSLTAGTGDPRGGYAARAASVLRDRGRPVSLTNLAVPGAETDDVLAALARPETARALARADLVLLSAGGNDLSHAWRGSESADPSAALPGARKNLAAILERLRTANSTAPIRLLGLYNPFEVEPGQEAQARAALLPWNVALEEATFPHRDVLVVPIADLFEAGPGRLAADRFHPGPRGHELITGRVLSTLPALER